MKTFRAILAASLVFAATDARAEEASLKILALGDSTTAGTPGFRSPVEWPPDGMGDPESQYAFWMKRNHLSWTVRNVGVAGDRTDQILGRFRTIVKSETYDYVIVLAGVNDLHQNVPIARVKENLTRIYDLAAQYRIKVVACTILPYDDAAPKVNANIRQANEWIKDSARERSFLLVDTHEVTEDPRNPGKLLRSPDGLHPNVEGYRAMGEAIATVLAKETAGP